MTEQWTPEEIKEVTAVVVADVKAASPSTPEEALQFAQEACETLSSKDRQVLARMGGDPTMPYTMNLQLTFLGPGGVPAYA